MANSQIRFSTSEYSAPPMKIIATLESRSAPSVQTTPRASTSARLRTRARRRSLVVDIAGNAVTITNWGRKSTALVRIRPPAYRPASCSSSTLRATTMSAFDSAKKESSASVLRVDSRAFVRSELVRPSSWWWSLRSSHQPTATEVNAPSVTPSIAAVSSGLARMNSVPNSSRGTPIAR
jgi:hypothetical protein